MPGDELHEEAGGPATAAPDAGHPRAGGRHAAPRKPLYSRLHLPAGKAIAIAAMPSAVLMGMGLTPQLANAKPMPKNPFKSGNCVSQEDREEEAKEKEEEQQKAEAEHKEKVAKAKKEAKEKEAKEQKRKAEAEKKKESADSGDSDGSGSSQDSGDSKDSGGLGSDDQQDDSGKSDNPLDPLGVGDKLGNALNPDKDKDKDAQDDKDSSGQGERKDSAGQDSSGQQSKSGSAQGSSANSGDRQSSGAGTSGGSGAKGEDLTKPVGDTVNKVGDGVKGTTGTVGKKVEDAAKEAGKTTEKLPSAGKGDNSGGNGKSYPCVEEKKSEGKDERTQATLPNDPWELESSKLSLHGLNYEGVVNVTTASGGKKQVLKFTADGVDIGDLHQIVQGPGGTKYHVQAEKGSNSTVRGGKVTMYTERLEGNLFGLIPIVFDPEHPPPLNVPEAMFTNAKVKQAGQFGGNLTVPGLHQSISNK